MANKIVGKIKEICATQNLTSKGGNQFSKRELVLDCTTYDQYTGEPRPNYPSFTFMSKHVTDLDSFKAGDRVQVSFFISGRPWEKDGVVRYINDIVAYKIESYVSNQGLQSAQSPALTTSPTPTAQTSQNVSNGVQQGSTENPPFPPNVDENGNVDDLPF